MAATPIEHVVSIVKENHTFDNYFGRCPGTNGDATLAQPNRRSYDMFSCFDFSQAPLAPPSPPPV